MNHYCSNCKHSHSRTGSADLAKCYSHKMVGTSNVTGYAAAEFCQIIRGRKTTCKGFELQAPKRANMFKRIMRMILK